VKPPIIAVSVWDRLSRSDFQFYRRVVPDTYTHTITAFGGYDTAQMTLSTTRTQAENWLEDGLGRHIEVYASALDVVWEGFIDQIRVNVAPLTVTLGPLLDACNRAYVMYSPLVAGAAGAASGGQSITANADDSDSQNHYGILPKVISAGTVTDTEAEYIRDVYLANNAWPKATESFTSQADRAVTVTLDCKGYYHWLNYPYTAAAGATINASLKIANVLAAGPNVSWLAFGPDDFQDNTLQVLPLEDQYRPALTVINDVVSRGDAFNDRWLFMILDNLGIYYYPAPTDIEYQAYIQDRGLVLQSPSQATIQPWRMLPGRWLSFVDFMVGRRVPDTATNADPRLMFVEKVTYRAPFGLQLQGGNTDEIYQVLARYGMGAM